MFPVVIRDGIAGNLVDPALEFLFIPQGIDARMNFQKDILQDIFATLFIWHTSKHELLEFGVKFFPDSLRRHNHSYVSLLRFHACTCSISILYYKARRYACSACIKGDGILCKRTQSDRL